jgi:hypothetical protein
MKLTWLLRGSAWRSRHLLQCHTCYKQFKQDAPGSIDVRSHPEDEVEQCLNFEGFSRLQVCPACAAPLWKEAVSVALYRRHFN